MPKFVSRGVYLDETGPGETAGSPRSLEGATLAALAVDLRHAMRAHVADWTDSNDSDPGVTLVEVFAYLAESLLGVANTTPQARAVAERAAATLAALGDPNAPSANGVKRPLFFFGRLLDAATLAEEQDYHREKLRRHNRAVLGYGTVSGLDVRLNAPDSGDSHIVLEPGYAIDRSGEEVCVPCVVTLPPPAHGDFSLVTLRFWEHPCGVADTAGAARTVEEACLIGIHAGVMDPAIALARLVRSDNGWRVDPGFTRPRVQNRP